MLTTYEDWKSDYDTCYNRLIKQFNSNSLKGFGIDDKDLSIIASGTILLYLDSNYFGKTNHITSISQIIDTGYMKIDDFTIKNLEIFHSLNTQNKKGTLINNIDFTLTSSGSRLLKKHLRKPLNNLKRINKRLSLLEELILDKDLLKNIRDLLKETFDIERVIGKISNLKSNPRDLINLSQSLEKLNEIKKIVLVKHKNLNSYLKKVKNNNKIIKLIFSSIIEDSPVIFLKENL